MQNIYKEMEGLTPEQREYIEKKYLDKIRKYINEAIEKSESQPPVIQSVRQFIPQTDEQIIAEANEYLQKVFEWD